MGDCSILRVQERILQVVQRTLIARVSAKQVGKEQRKRGWKESKNTVAVYEKPKEGSGIIAGYRSNGHRLSVTIKANLIGVAEDNRKQRVFLKSRNI